MSSFFEKVQVNIPFTMLYESYLDHFLRYSMNPEIGLDALALDRFSLEDFRGISRQLHERGLVITLHGPFTDLSAGSSDRMIRDVTRHRLEQTLELVPIFKPKTVVCHLGYDPARHWYMRELWMERSLEIWSWLGQRLRDHGAMLMLENVYEQDPDDIATFFESLQSSTVGFCLDTGHQAVFSRVPLKGWLSSLGGYIKQLHLHDNFGVQDDHLALGHGNIDFIELFRKLRTLMTRPPIITMEPHQEGDLRPSLQYLQEIWPWKF
ncbi:MAG: sugar phosphate isomerase/epimerase [Thermodesulfobacteriota bacterium]|nr:sugar phosphate isomerase/epimerase [Thermodesulfobacteriota bacterium]